MTSLADGCVLDASVALAVTLNESLRDSAQATVAAVAHGVGRLVAPTLFDVECASGVVKAVRQGRLRADLWVEAWLGLLDLPVERISSPTAVFQGIQLALESGVSAYDAVYVALADELELPLVTADARLVRALAGSPHAILYVGDVDLSGPPPRRSHARSG